MNAETATVTTIEQNDNAQSLAANYGQQATSVLRQVQAMPVIVTDQMAASADDLLAKVSTAEKTLDRDRKSITKPIDDAKKKVMDLFREPVAQLGECKRLLKRNLAGYAERQRMEAQKKAEEERKRIERNAAKRAETAAKHGDDERAEEIRAEAEEQAAIAAATVAAAPVAKTSVSTRSNWKAECTSLKELVAAVAAGKAPITLLQFNQKDANAFAKATKNTIPVPGVRFFDDPIIASRGK